MESRERDLMYKENKSEQKRKNNVAKENTQ